MKGLELSEKYYLEYGREAIEKEFPKGKIAVGLVGQGSECFGYDDELSRDHDFEPGFCIWITREDYEDFGFELERVYRRLPKQFEGFERLSVAPAGGNRHGVMVIEDFYRRFLGIDNLPTSLDQWFSIPKEGLATITNGRVFTDELGVFSKIRSGFMLGYPEDVRLKKMSAHSIMMVQTGLYNYNRCVSRGETGAAQLCVVEFVKHAIALIYLLNNSYEPFYKWVYRKMRELDRLAYLECSLTSLTELGNSELEIKVKNESMEEICLEFAKEFKRQGLIDNANDEFGKHAFSIQNRIKDLKVRNMHIMDGI